MKDQIMQQRKELENLIGFSVRRKAVPLELNEPHDESFSYGLCQRFYGRAGELEKAISEANGLLMMLLRENRLDPSKAAHNEIGLLYALVGNMYYLLGDYRMSAGYFLRCLSYNKNDITPWIELLFSLRAIGRFELFEKGIFNLEKIYNSWKENPETGMTQALFNKIIKDVV